MMVFARREEKLCPRASCKKFGRAQQDALAPEIREQKARLDALESGMERNEAAAERGHSKVLNTVRDAMEIPHLHERIARLEGEREPKLQHPG